MSNIWLKRVCDNPLIIAFDRGSQCIIQILTTWLPIFQRIYGQYHTVIDCLHHIYVYIGAETEYICIPVHNAAKVN